LDGDLAVGRLADPLCEPIGGGALARIVLGPARHQLQLFLALRDRGRRETPRRDGCSARDGDEIATFHGSPPGSGVLLVAAWPHDPRPKRARAVRRDAISRT